MPCDIAVFYRTNAQSRVFEEVFIRVGLPYKVVGGVRFYERREVRDALAYLRVLVNPADVVSLRRILNVPKRGIGDRAEAAIATLAERERITFFEALHRAEDAPGLATRSLNAIQGFVAMIDELTELADGSAPGDVARGRARPHRLPRGAAGQRRPAGRGPGREPRGARLRRPGVRADPPGRHCSATSSSRSRWSPTPTRCRARTAPTASSR